MKLLSAKKINALSKKIIMRKKVKEKITSSLLLKKRKSTKFEKIKVAT